MKHLKFISSFGRAGISQRSGQGIIVHGGEISSVNNQSLSIWRSAGVLKVAAEVWFWCLKYCALSFRAF